MAADVPILETTEITLPEHQLERYWAVWQFPEGRYAYMIDLRRKGWLILLDSKEAGEAYLLSDARMNGRAPSQYRLDELTLPDAFDAVRAQEVPFISSYGHPVRQVLGVMLRSGTLRYIPV